MATSADIETALVTAVAAVLYPQGGVAFAGTVSVARGWPTEADIRTAMGAQTSLIGIYAVSGMTKEVVCALRYWQQARPGVAAMEVGRIEQGFRLDLWACTPDVRDELLTWLIPALKFQTRYTMPDGSTATLLRLQATGPDDRPSRADEWAQSLELTIQYPVIYTQPQPVVTQITQATTINEGLTIITQTPTQQES